MAPLHGALAAVQEEARRAEEDLATLADVNAALARGGDPEKLIAHVVDRIAKRLSVERCSVVLIDETGRGTVAAASGDPGARGMSVDLALYPEIREVLRTSAPLVIGDRLRHGALDTVRDRLEGQDLTAIAVVPMVCEGQSAGVLVIRARNRAGFVAREMALLSAVASAAAVALRNAGRVQSERKTKEFLERLIDATEGGIVATDLHGLILLFNKGAERITGYSSLDVVGKKRVSELYPPGQAHEIMRRLRQGVPVGRCELVAAGGERIPIDLSAALVFEDGAETAVVGVLRDLREELRAAAELHETRERLAVAEKAAVVSELAGAAAHELNQPLTSVLGFSELLFRRTAEPDKGREELLAIVREAERMAGIVKKIGKITRYETTQYVGATRIVDLKRSSDADDPIVIRDEA
jgi:PAS domain S-box-containing protein